MTNDYFRYPRPPKQIGQWIAMLLCLVVLTASAQNAVQVAGTATAQSAQTGDWTNPSTWVGNQVPGANARVLINANHTVTVDGVINTNYKSVRIAPNGTLNYATNANTELRTEYLVSQPGGTFEIGNESGKIQADRTARLTFAWLGGTTQSADPSRFAPGAVLMGKVRMHGAEKTSWTTLTTHPSSGTTQLSLGSAPTGWRIGDEIVIAGTDPNDYQSDELRTISSISGNTVTLNSALTKNHQPPSQLSSIVDVHVSNNTRNIIVSSERTEKTSISGQYGKPRGHMMFMHNPDVIVKYIETENTGRTDKTIELDDWSVPEDEQARFDTTTPYPTGPGTNPRGRYSIHFHRSLDTNNNKALVQGCVVNDDPGWGYTNHSSNVDFIENVSYKVTGSAFCTEAGDEVGSFLRNIAIRTYNNTEPLNLGRPAGGVLGLEGGRTEGLTDGREQISDFAFQGDGFWVHGTGVTIEGNVVSGASGHAYIYWTEGLWETGRGRPTMNNNIDLYVDPLEFPILNAEVKARAASSSNWLFDVWYILSKPFKDNIGYTAAQGFRGDYMMTEFHEISDSNSTEYNQMPPNYRNKMNFVVENTLLWSIRRTGMQFETCAQITLKNNKVYGYGASTALAPWRPQPNPYPGYLEVEPHSIGIDLDNYHNTRNWTLENNIIAGWDGNSQALTLPINANVLVDGGTFDNSGTDIFIREVNWAKSWWENPSLIRSLGETTDPSNGNKPVLQDPRPLANAAPWRNLTITGNIVFNNPSNNIVMDAQMHLVNNAGDSFALLHEDGSGVKAAAYFLLPDNVTLDFGSFNNAKLYFDEQASGFIPVPTQANSGFDLREPFIFSADQVFPERRIPSYFVGKTNTQLQSQYGSSMGGEVIPAQTNTSSLLSGGVYKNGSGNKCNGVTPSVPTSLTATNNGCTSVSLTWTGVSCTTGYRIQRSIDGAAWTTLNANVSGTNFTDSSPTTGDLRYRVSALNSNGFNSVDRTSNTINCSASNQSPTVSITGPSEGATFTEGDNITVNATAADADGTVTQVQFFQGSTLLGTDTSSPYSFAWNNVSAGNYALTAVATDNNSATTTSTVVNITVNSTSNQSPTASITSPTNGATFTTGDNVTINATASDADGTITKVEFFQGSTKLGEDTTAPYAYVWNNVAQGSYALTAVATDNNSATTTSSTVNITVNPSSGGGLNAEGGSITVSTGGFTTVSLSNAYTNPVVVATPVLPTTSTAPVVTRVRNVTGSSFQLKVQNPSGTTVNGIEVQYLVVEAGTYTLAANGVKMEAKTVSSTITGRKNGWSLETETYNQSYTSPVVLGQVMSENDVNWSVFYASSGSRTSPPSTSALRAGKHVGEDTNTTRANETVGLIIFEAGSGTFDGINFQAGVGADNVQGTQNSTSGYNYSHSVSGATGAVLSAAGMDGGDGGWPVFIGGSAISGSSITMAFDEDQISNSERSHTTEQVAYVVFADAGGDPCQGITPTAPASLIATNNSCTSVSLSWAASTCATSYRVQRSVDGGSWTTLSANVSGTSYADNSPAAGNLQYRVRAQNSNGNSGNSTSSTIDCQSTGNDCSGLTYNDYLGAGHASGVTATASTVDESATPIKTVNGSGLSGGSNGTHNTAWADSWTSTSNSGQYIQYDFGAAYPLGQMHVWNGNEVTSRGLNNVTIKYSATSSNPSNMTTLGTYTWPAASGASSYAGFAGPNFNGVDARYVRIEVNTNHGSQNHVALSEVRFDLNCSSSAKTAKTLGTDSNNQSIQITLFPNPVKSNEVFIRFNGIKDDVKLNIFDTAGRQLISERLKVNSNMTHKVDLVNFQSGNYFIMLEHSQGTRSFQLIKE